MAPRLHKTYHIQTTFVFSRRPRNVDSELRRLLSLSVVPRPASKPMANELRLGGFVVTGGIIISASLVPLTILSVAILVPFAAIAASSSRLTSCGIELVLQSLRDRYFPVADVSVVMIHPTNR